jgi:hydroxymethylpyrimidine/phosphomethylpyrimidine kinase
VHRLIPLNANDLLEQASAIFNDMPIAVIKIGLTGSINVVRGIVDILKSQPDIPVIFDPVLACGDGTTLANEELIKVIKDELLPLTTVITPNTLEAAQLSALPNNTEVEKLGIALLSLGAEYAFLTGGHASDQKVNNYLFHKNQSVKTTEWPRQAGEFHGTGCTLATAVAALIANGHLIPEAIELAQAYVDSTIIQAQQIGKGQLFPNRFPQ